MDFFIASTTFLIIPFIFNLVAIVVIVNKFIKEFPTFRDWIIENSWITGLVTLIACSNLESLNLLNSRIFHLKYFSAGWSDKTSHFLQILGVVNIFLEDIPQMIIQIYYLSSQPNPSDFVIISLVSGALVLFFGILKRLVLFLALRQQDKAVYKSKETELSIH